MLTTSSVEKLDNKKRGYPGNDIKFHSVVRLEFWSSEENGVTPLMSLHLGSLWSRVKVPTMILSVGLMDLFKDYLYYTGILDARYLKIISIKKSDLKL